MKVIVLVATVYLSGAFLTAAYYEQRVYEPCIEKMKTDWDRYTSCGQSAFVGYFWPAYWAWRGALIVTK